MQTNLGMACIFGQSRMVIHTMVNPKWFERWNKVNEPEMGEEYEKYKKRFANHLFDWACVHFPKLKQKVNFGYECCTTCQVILHYKFQMVWSEYKIPYMTMWCFTSGQDVFSGGCSGALHGGLLCASDVMDHCLYIDLLLLQKKLKRMVVKKVE